MKWLIIFLLVFTFIGCNKTPTYTCRTYDEGLEKYICIERVAVDRAEQDICDEITEEYTRDHCIAEVAIKNLDSLSCNLIKTKKHDFYCRKNIARQLENTSICEPITDWIEKDNCFFIALKNSTNPEDCNIIRSEIIRYDCVGRSLQELNSV